MMYFYTYLGVAATITAWLWYMNQRHMAGKRGYGSLDVDGEDFVFFVLLWPLALVVGIVAGTLVSLFWLVDQVKRMFTKQVLFKPSPAKAKCISKKGAHC